MTMRTIEQRETVGIQVELRWSLIAHSFLVRARSRSSRTPHRTFANLVYYSSEALAYCRPCPGNPDLGCERLAAEFCVEPRLLDNHSRRAAAAATRGGAVLAYSGGAETRLGRSCNGAGKPPAVGPRPRRLSTAHPLRCREGP